jgi:hypothetical protein
MTGCLVIVGGDPMLERSDQDEHLDLEQAVARPPGVRTASQWPFSRDIASMPIPGSTIVE